MGSKSDPFVGLTASRDLIKWLRDIPLLRLSLDSAMHLNPSLWTINFVKFYLDLVYRITMK